MRHSPRQIRLVAWYANGKIHRIPAKERTFPDWDEVRSTTSVEARRLPGGAFLLKVGPWVSTWSPWGLGMCGACPTIFLRIYRLDPVQGIVEILSVSERAEAEIPDVWTSPDWQTVAIRWLEPTSRPPRWLPEKQQTRCFTGAKYEPCANNHAPGLPDKRQIGMEIP